LGEDSFAKAGKEGEVGGAARPVRFPSEFVAVNVEDPWSARQKSAHRGFSRSCWSRNSYDFHAAIIFLSKELQKRNRSHLGGVNLKTGGDFP
jgi:hypothetical protein